MKRKVSGLSPCFSFGVWVDAYWRLLLESRSRGDDGFEVGQTATGKRGSVAKEAGLGYATESHQIQKSDSDSE